MKKKKPYAAEMAKPRKPSDQIGSLNCRAIPIAVAVGAFSVLTSCAPAPEPVERKMIGMLEKFDRWDHNGDGRLSVSELGEAEQIGGVPADEIIKFYDTDGDRLISLREGQVAVSRVDEARQVAEGLER